MPGNCGMYERLGLTRAQWNHIRNGRSAGRVSKESVEIIERGCQALGIYRESLLLSDGEMPISPWLLRARISISDIGDKQPARHKKYTRKKDAKS